MKPSINNPSLLKIASVFTAWVLVVDLAIDLMATHFKSTLLGRMLSWEYWIYDIAPELLVTFLCAIITTLMTSKLKDFTWKPVVLRVLSFALVYTVVCLVISFVVFMATNGSNFKLYNPIDFIFLITGIRVGFIFQVVWALLKYQQMEGNES